MLFSAQNFTKNTDKIACLVCGFGGNIASYSKAIKALKSAGYDVVAYEYTDKVFTEGDPNYLLSVIQQISDDFALKSTKYKNVLAAGVSLGAYIAFNVQRRNPNIKQGVYGTAGISVAHAIFTAKVFGRFRKKFIANGYTEMSLEKVWKDIEILEDLDLAKDKSIVIVKGGMDRIVRYKTASKMMDTWKARGINVEYFAKRGLGHAMTIGWYKNHLHELLNNRVGG